MILVTQDGQNSETHKLLEQGKILDRMQANQQPLKRKLRLLKAKNRAAHKTAELHKVRDNLS
jgi:hypothetical protein